MHTAYNKLQLDDSPEPSEVIDELNSSHIESDDETGVRPVILNNSELEESKMPLTANNERERQSKTAIPNSDEMGEKHDYDTGNPYASEMKTAVKEATAASNTFLPPIEKEHMTRDSNNVAEIISAERE